MRHRLHRLTSVVAVVALASVTIFTVSSRAQTSTPAVPAENTVHAPDATAPHTPWGEPDLQGIWSVELLVPLERPAGVTSEFYTDEEVAELDQLRAGYSVFGNHVRE